MCAGKTEKRKEDKLIAWVRMAVADAAAAEAATLMTGARSVVLTSLAQYLLLGVFFRILLLVAKVAIIPRKT